MRDWQSLAHVKWECKYHVVIVPKYRRQSLFGHVRKRIGKIFQQFCRQKEIELVEGHAMLDHVHMVLSIPPKLSVAMAVGYLKGKSAIQVHREALNVKQGFTGKHFWSRGYCVSTVGLDGQMIRAYVKNQDDLDRQEDLFNQ
ncbi:MAG: IS200/IS605 family transposase [Gammaproteobacteria bacterium]